MLFSAINLGEELWITLDCVIIGTHTWVGDIGGLVSGGNIIQLSHLRLAKKRGKSSFRYIDRNNQNIRVYTNQSSKF